jgi:predicted N-acetyltransferase YhbS
MRISGAVEKRTVSFPGRDLLREEVELVWTIDRSEVIDNVYGLEQGSLVLRPEHHDVRGWPAGEAEKYTPILLDCFDRGGWFHGLFDAAQLAAAAVLDLEPIGELRDRLQLKFLHVGREYRNRGLGARLFELARKTACARGARRLYVSATPSEHTIDFYLRRGCTPARQPDAELFALEPEDIHLECDV